MNEHRFTLRIDERYEKDRKAWQKLNTIQQRTHQSFNRIVVDALNAYDCDHLHLAPEYEGRLVTMITESVAEKLQQLLPAYLAGYTAGATVSLPSVKPANRISEAAMERTPEGNDDIPDFSSSVMDWNFIGG